MQKVSKNKKVLFNGGPTCQAALIIYAGYTEKIIEVDKSIIIESFFDFCRGVQKIRTETEKDLSKEALLNLCARAKASAQGDPLSLDCNDCFLVSVLLILMYWFINAKLIPDSEAVYNFKKYAEDIFLVYSTSFSFDDNEALIVLRDYVIYNDDDIICCKEWPVDPAFSPVCTNCEKYNHKKSKVTRKLYGLIFPASSTSI